MTDVDKLLWILAFLPTSHNCVVFFCKGGRLSDQEHEDSGQQPLNFLLLPGPPSQDRLIAQPRREGVAEIDIYRNYLPNNATGHRVSSNDVWLSSAMSSFDAGADIMTPTCE